MNDRYHADTAQPTTSRWPRRLFVAFLVLLFFGLLFGGILFYMTRSADRKLQEVMAEIDRTDPGWRWDDLQAKRQPVPDERNSALQVLAVKKLMPDPWNNLQVDQALQNLEPEILLNEYQAALLETELAKLAAVLAEARKLVDMPAGRYPLMKSPVLIGMLVNYVQDARVAASLLSYDAIAQAQKGDIDGALGACRAGLNVSRSIGDEPTLISQLVRIACRGIAVRKLERVLAQGEASAAALAELQPLLEQDEAEPLFLFAVRGERAFNEDMMQQLRAGNVSMAQLMGGGPTSGNYKIGSIDLEDIALRLFSGPMASQSAAVLRYMTQMVEIARKPLEEQQQDIQTLEASVPSMPVLARLLVPAVSKVWEACRRSHADLRCAVATVAAERYRLAHGRWPESLDELVKAGLLKEVPVDPYDRSPLRLKRVEDGIVIYSVGPDGKDDGGTINRQNPTAAGSDVGYRLWDMAQRRQPPLNPAVGPPKPKPGEQAEPEPSDDSPPDPG